MTNRPATKFEANRVTNGLRPAPRLPEHWHHEVIIGYLCSIAVRHRIHYLWRPVLPDPKDDMVLEVAVAGQCESIVTFNVKDFRGTERFGIHVITPLTFLREIGEIP